MAVHVCRTAGRHLPLLSLRCRPHRAVLQQSSRAAEQQQQQQQQQPAGRARRDERARLTCHAVISVLRLPASFARRDELVLLIARPPTPQPYEKPKALAFLLPSPLPASSKAATVRFFTPHTERQWPTATDSGPATILRRKLVSPARASSSVSFAQRSLHRLPKPFICR